MHRIIAGYLKTFCDENFINNKIPESKRFEFFSNFCIIESFYPDHIDVQQITSEEDDAGIDGICFFIDGEVVLTIDEAEEIFKRPKKNMPVDIYCIQAKTSDSYDKGEILKFNDGMSDFVAEKSQLPQGNFIRSAKAIFNLILEHIDKVDTGRPNLHARYVCVSNNEIADEIEAVRVIGLNQLRKTGMFNNVDYEYIGLEQLIKLWDKTRHSSSAVISTKQISSFPKMNGVEEAYVAVVPLKSYVENVLFDEDHKLKLQIFEENVRAYLGEKNPVNDQIAATIKDPLKQERFAILNNGVTIISPNVRIQNDKISLENYQIVNGCQTSSVLYDNYDSLTSAGAITVKVIEATDPDIIAEVVKATNSQTKVESTQFLSFSPVIRRIEKYFNTTEDKTGEEVKLYFERRSGQYRADEVPKSRIFSIGETCRAVGAMFLHKPEIAYRYPTKMLANMRSQLLNNKNKEIVYYTAALALYRYKLLAGNGRIDSKYNIYKWHILMTLYYVANHEAPVPISQKGIEPCCKLIIKKCVQSDDECLDLFNDAIKVLIAVGLKKDRDEIRTATYTQSLLAYCNKNLVKK